MNPKHFQEDLAFFQEQKEKAQAEIEKLRNKYIEENAEFKVGEKVKVVTKAHTSTSTNYNTNQEETEYHPETERLAYIRNIVVFDSGKLIYDLVKPKKDGSPSSLTDYWGGELETIVKL